MGTINLTIGKLTYHTSDDTTNNWYDIEEVASGYAHYANKPARYCWWVSRIEVRTPAKIEGSEHDLILKLKLRNDTNSYPQNSIAVLSDTAFGSKEVIIDTDDTSNNGSSCGCGNNHCKTYHHLGPNMNLFYSDGVNSVTSLSYTNPGGFGVPKDPSKNTFIYYRFPGFNFSVNKTYYIYIMYQKRNSLDGGNSTNHGFVGVYKGNTRIMAYLEYNDNQSLTVYSKLNGRDDTKNTALNRYGTVNISLNNSKSKAYTAFSQSLAHNTYYKIDATTDNKKYVYDPAGSNGVLAGFLDSTRDVILNFKSVYELVFNSCGGPTIDNIYKVHNVDINLPSCSKTGATFLGWKVGSSDILTGKYTSNPNSYSTTFEAQWCDIGYEVTFDAATNNGILDNPGDAKKLVVYGKNYGKLPVARKDGYEFLGWFTESVGGTRITETTTVSVAGDHTLYAQYAVLTYKIYYYVDGKPVYEEKNTPTVEYGSNFTVDPAARKVGNQFLHWKHRDANEQFTPEDVITYTYNHNIYLDAVFNQNIPTVNLYTKNNWMVVVPHKYDGKKWVPVELDLNVDKNSVDWKDFKYYNWI